MYERKYVEAIARSIYQGYIKDTTGEVVRWADLPNDERIVWRNMAKRAARRIEELAIQMQAADRTDAP